ncbi:RAMP superfamily CRISPR-associated protein [Streptosporangium sp. G11]|uniref:RAMP superfamily CRISPR-associated protein n=1 Tax=Streptosporangium sp. G11 TaxID=3436926 RepID=UPI003EB99F1D
MNETGSFAISLFMVSDWRVGTGTGIQGYADRLVQRDGEEASRPVLPGNRDRNENGDGTVRQDGLDGTEASPAPAAPIVPAKTLVGVWRDSCELAAHALDSGPSGVWHDWVGFLFGGRFDGKAPRPAALVVEGPLRFPVKLARLLRARPQVAWAATFRKPGVAIDVRTGTAEAEMLRFEEMARAGVTLTGRGRIEGFAELDQGQRDVAVALLGAGARLLEGIGGKRRRGSGRCAMTVEGAGFAPVWSMPPPERVVPPPAGPAYAVADRPVPVSRPTRAGWERAELVITVQEAVLAAATVLGNVVKGAGHVPGWCLMPEVARRLGGGAHALVRTGDLLVTAATPESAGGARTLPVPKVFVHEKGKPGTVTGNRMAGAVSSGKPYRGGYVVPDGEDVHEVVDPPSMLRMHNSIRDDVQRPTRDIGGVYVYRALAAGTALRAEVRVRAGALEEGWEERLNGRWRVGRSSKDDYGQVEVVARPVAEGRRAAGGGDLLRVWLLSELLVRDLRLRPSTEVEDVKRALEQALAKAGASGVSLTPVIGRRDGRVGVALGVHRTESWHRGWGLPRPTLYGLAAGSCLTFEVTGGPIAPDVLAEVRAAGVGERRAEGFGQVELDHDLLLLPVEAAGSHGIRSSAVAPIEDSPSGPLAVAPDNASPAELTVASDEMLSAASQVASAGTSVPRLLTPGEDGYDTARIFERAAWRAEIHRACERIKGDRESRSRVVPTGVPSTQLNALREIVREPSRERAKSRLLWLTRTRAGRPDWPREAVTRLLDLLTTTDPVWALLALPEERLVVTGDGVATLRAELHCEAVRVLVSACLAAHSRDEAAGSRERTTRNGDAGTVTATVGRE